MNAKEKRALGKKLLKTVCANDLNPIKELLAAGADPNAMNDYGRTPLHIAVSCCKDEICRLLLEAGADPMAKDKDGQTPLHYATEGTKVRLLLEAGADPMAKDAYGRTPLQGRLWWTDESKDAVSVGLLLAAGANPNAKDNGSLTPLHCARDGEVVELLLGAGADPNAENESGLTPLCCAHDAKTVRLLLASGADPMVKERNSGCTCHEGEGSGKTPLHFICNTRSASPDLLDAVRLLVAAGVDVNSQDAEGNTALLLAKNEDIVLLLLELGADLDAVTKHDGADEVKRIIKELKKQGKLYKFLKSSLLHQAKDVETARRLLEQGVDPNALDAEGRTPLHEATWNVDLMRLLLEHGANPNIQDPEGLTPLYAARSVEAIDLLLNAGANPNVQDVLGDTVLHKISWLNIAPSKGEAVRLLLKKGADPKAKNKKGETPLHHMGYCAEAVRLLLAAGADPNAVDKKENTPLHNGTEWDAESVEILNEAGANWKATNCFGEIPTQTSDDLKEIFKKLKAAGKLKSLSPDTKKTAKPKKKEVIQKFIS